MYQIGKNKYCKRPQLKWQWTGQIACRTDKLEKTQGGFTTHPAD